MYRLALSIVLSYADDKPCCTLSVVSAQCREPGGHSKTTLLEQLDTQRQCFRHVTRMRRPNSPTSGVPIYPTYPSLFLDVSWPQTSRRVQQSPGWLSGFSVHIVRNEAAGLLSRGPITLYDLAASEQPRQHPCQRAAASLFRARRPARTQHSTMFIRAFRARRSSQDHTERTCAPGHK
ncbi:hypothetical protein OH76DRAFT_111309 [Lentinus brumalis]|uniref:Uncharacterized protein n=1 Tax=Lentinus brumalis TaxID=2498619 RepID=A0A371CPZ1_9APHY|nr:hypothetical protein OH76DRAFT_111309 [Polyporus brumalis]